MIAALAGLGGEILERRFEAIKQEIPALDLRCALAGLAGVVPEGPFEGIPRVIPAADPQWAKTAVTFTFDLRWFRGIGFDAF